MREEILKVEYLIVMDDNNGFCSDLKGFNNLIQANSDIQINNKELKYQGLVVDYDIQTGMLNEEKERFFHVHLTCKDISKLSEFESLRRIMMQILHKVCKVTPQLLWDDASIYYAKKAYPLINEIENLMRKLITKFMLVNVGIGWTKENVPEEVKNSVKSKDKTETNDFLYKTDFIQLSKFLFNEYSTSNFKDLLNKLKKKEEFDKLDKQQLKKYVPASNWERFFSELVEFEGESLRKKWATLYELRNKVAHNNHIVRQDYEEIDRLVNSIREVLKKAIESLDQIHISREEREMVAESVVGEASGAAYRFITEYNTLNKIVLTLAKKLGYGDKYTVLKPLALYLRENSIIDSRIYQALLQLQVMRNYLVHGLNLDEDNDLEIHELTILCKEIKKLLEVHISDEGDINDNCIDSTNPETD